MLDTSSSHQAPPADWRRDDREPAVRQVDNLAWEAGAPASSALESLRRELEKAVTRICPTWLSAQSDDLVQMSLMRVVEQIRNCDEHRSFNASYLRRTAYCALVDEIRRVRSRREWSTTDESGGDHPLESHGPDPEQRLIARQIGSHIRACLTGLITPRRVAVALKLQGESAPEAARLLGWSLRKTENLIYRGLADLRKCLSQKGLSKERGAL